MINVYNTRDSNVRIYFIASCIFGDYHSAGTSVKPIPKASTREIPKIHQTTEEDELVMFAIRQIRAIPENRRVTAVAV